MAEATALIVDDERLMRDQLRQRLASVWPELAICGEAENGLKALELFDAHQPTFLFLDIRMPGLNGLEVAARLNGQAHIVFITAYDQHAIEAFERGAIDYLLKPVEEERLALTVERLKSRMAQQPPQLDEIIDRLSQRLLPANQRSYLRWVKASLGSNLRIIPVEEIVYFHAEDKYTRIFTAQQEVLVKKPIKELVDELDPDKFWQIHRGTIVNAGEITGAVRDLRGRLMITLKSRADKLEVSRTFTHLFKQM
jgi:DNA-binding LytR/AlgR family response regulator